LPSQLINPIFIDTCQYVSLALVLLRIVRCHWRFSMALQLHQLSIFATSTCDGEKNYQLPSDGKHVIGQQNHYTAIKIECSKRMYNEFCDNPMTEAFI
jgi:hypothetical protein